MPPADFRLPTVPREAVLQRPNGRNGVLADFGRETFGFVVFRGVTGSGRVKVIYGESEPEALCDGLDDERIGLKPTSADVWEYLDLVAGERFVNPKSRGFRYVNVVPVAGDVRVTSLSLEEEIAPLEFRGGFRCSDERLNRIWEVSARTLHLTAREFLLDGIKRDRFVWSGDAYQSCQMSYYVFGAPSVVRRTLWALRGKEPVWMHINRIADYTFYWFAMVREYYLYSGDIGFLRMIYPRMLSLMDYVEGRLRPDGLYEARPGDWVFVDWAPEPLENYKGPVAAEQILLVRAQEALAGIARILGDMAKSEEYEAKGGKLRAKVKSLFWDSGKGGLVHTLDHELKPLPQFTRYPNILALLYGYFNADEAGTVKEKCLLNENVMPIVTPYMRYYELEVMCRLGCCRQVLDEVREYWGGMLDHGATSFWEMYDPKEKGVEHYAMYGRPFGRSLCHAWGASPAYIFGRYILGVVPTSPGFGTYEVKPDLGGLDWAEGDVPTPWGKIHVRVDAAGHSVREIRRRQVN